MATLKFLLDALDCNMVGVAAAIENFICMALNNALKIENKNRQTSVIHTSLDHNDKLAKLSLITILDIITRVIYQNICLSHIFTLILLLHILMTPESLWRHKDVAKHMTHNNMHGFL